MRNEYIVWGDGVPNATSNIYKDKKYNIIESSYFKNGVENVYIKDECVLFVTKGEIFKEGILNFERSETPKDHNSEGRFVNLVPLIPNTREVVVDLAFGDNHILIQTAQGNVYAWGDNYYGQLGLGNFFVAKLFDPHQIKMNAVKKIYAYKNNSFAIDTNNKLWVWGQTDLLGNNLKGNVFKPVSILSQFIVQSLKIQNDRVIVCVQEDQKSQESKAEGDEDEDDVEEDTPKEPEKETPPDKKDPASNAADEQQSSAKKNKAEEVTSNEAAQMVTVLKKINSDISDALVKLNSESKSLTDVRNKVLSDQSIIKRNGIDMIWSEINNILNQTEVMNKKTVSKINNMNSVSIADTIDVFTATLNAVITGCFNSLNVDRLVENFVSYEKEITKLITDMQEDVVLDDNLNKLSKNIQTLLNYAIKYKKLETLIHKMSAHQFLLKSFRFENVLNGLKFITDKDENVEKKLYLIERTFESLRLLIEKTNSSFVEIEALFGNLNRVNFINDESGVEKYLHKHIIESTFYIKDLWELLIHHVEEEKKSKEKVAQIVRILDKYKELYSIQMYLRSISLKKIFQDKNTGKNKNSGVDNELKNKMVYLMTEIDGAITRLEYFMNERIDDSKMNTDNFSNVKNKYKFFIIF